MENLKGSPDTKILIAFRLSPADHQRIVELAQKHGVPFSVALRAALEVGLSQILDQSAPER